jgi:hypothetical protein
MRSGENIPLATTPISPAVQQNHAACRGELFVNGRTTIAQPLLRKGWAYVKDYDWQPKCVRTLQNCTSNNVAKYPKKAHQEKSPLPLSATISTHQHNRPPEINFA